MWPKICNWATNHITGQGPMVDAQSRNMANRITTQKKKETPTE